MKVLITLIPFGNKNKLPLDLLKKSNIEYVLNPLNKKPSEEELLEMVEDCDAIIAGTEKISKNVINNAMADIYAAEENNINFIFRSHKYNLNLQIDRKYLIINDFNNRN